MTIESYQLSNDSYVEHLIDAMQDMFNGSDFTDLTLVCDDVEMVKTHKAILSACSPVFKKMLQYSKDSPETMIFLKGYKKEDLKALLQFIFTGEVVVNQTRADKVLKIAEEFKFKGVNVDQQENHETDVATDEEKIENSKNSDESMDEESINNEAFELLGEPIIKEELIEDKDIKDKPYKCPNSDCSMAYTDKSNCLRHYKKKHQVERDQLRIWYSQNKTFERKVEVVYDKKYKCPSSGCLHSYTDKSNLHRHFKQKHQDSSFNASVNGTIVDTNEETINDNLTESQVDDSVSTNDFDQDDTQEVDMKEEQADSLEDQKQFPCGEPGCSKSYTDRANRNRHYKQKHQNQYLSSI